VVVAAEAKVHAIIGCPMSMGAMKVRQKILHMIGIVSTDPGGGVRMDGTK